jgi:hypothetical protein
MNRIVLIGNGFDLAHGLKTSYADFINWYWEQWMNKILFSLYGLDESDGLCSIRITNYHIPKNTYLNGLDYINALENKPNISFSKGVLIQEIMKDFENSNWVDIESVYYRLLCESMKENPRITHKELNKQLDVLTQKLYEYLILNNNECNIEINDSIKKKLYESIKKHDIAVEAKQTFLDLITERIEYSKTYDLIGSYINELSMYKSIHKYDIEDYIKDLQEKDESIWEMRNNDTPALLPNSIMLVNFNYTHTADTYLPKFGRHFRINHIHGDLKSLNSMIFGYGDELDDCYKEISNKNDNEYLRNVKSIKYLEASNYRELLQFIDSKPYQIYIMGHSCGNSDRTLLNTLFEHKNCVSIKPFYYKKEDGTDNYTEIVQNISRNFVDKKALRDRVVNKKLCEPLLKKTKKEKLSSVEYYCEALKNMKRTTIGGVKSPYKPLLMLSIIDLFNASTIENNKNADNQNLIIEITKYLENIFKNEWEEHPRSTYKFDYDIVNVLFYMQDEPFYALGTLSEEINLYQRLLEIDKSFYYIKFDSDLIKLLTNSTTRQQLRDVLEEMLN